MTFYGWPAAVLFGGIAVGLLAFAAVLFLIIGGVSTMVEKGVLPAWIAVLSAALLFVIAFGTLGYFMGIHV